MIINKQTDGSVVISIGRFELCGEFSKQCLDAFKTMAEQYESVDPYDFYIMSRIDSCLDLVVEVCTNSPESMSDEQVIVAFDFIKRLIAKNQA